MTNKDSIQQKHLEAINDVTADTSMWGEYGGINVESKKDAATSCTTITIDSISDWEQWKIDNEYLRFGLNNTYYKKGTNKEFTHSELIQLFLNQKAKI